MSVIVNDFEIIPDPPENGTVDEQEAPAPAAIQPIDVVEIVERAERREHRLRAH